VESTYNPENINFLSIFGKDFTVSRFNGEDINDSEWIRIRSSFIDNRNDVVLVEDNTYRELCSYPGYRSLCSIRFFSPGNYVTKNIPFPFITTPVSMVIDQRNHLWIAAKDPDKNSELWVQPQDGNWEKLNAIDSGLKQNSPKALAVDKQNNLWIATDDWLHSVDIDEYWEVNRFHGWKDLRWWFIVLLILLLLAAFKQTIVKLLNYEHSIVIIAAVLGFPATYFVILRVGKINSFPICGMVFSGLSALIGQSLGKKWGHPKAGAIIGGLVGVVITFLVSTILAVTPV
jgi:hypothetical protein